MASYLLEAGAAMCQHGGKASPMAPTPRVKLSGQPAVTQTSAHAVTGSTLVPPPLPACVTAQWVTAAVRVKSRGQPLVLQSSQAVCAQNGFGLMVVIQHVRVKAT